MNAITFGATEEFANGRNFHNYPAFQTGVAPGNLLGAWKRTNGMNQIVVSAFYSTSENTRRDFDL